MRSDGIAVVHPLHVCLFVSCDQRKIAHADELVPLSKRKPTALGDDGHLAPELPQPRERRIRDEAQAFSAEVIDQGEIQNADRRPAHPDRNV